MTKVTIDRIDRALIEQALETLLLHKEAHPVAYRRAVEKLRAALAEPAPVPRLSNEELEAIEVREKPANGPKSTLNFARAIESAVRQKVGL